MKTAEQTWRNTALPTEQRVAALMEQMTLEEKAGQLGSYWIRPEEENHDSEANVAPMADTFSGGPSFDTAIQNGLGHITRAFGTVPVDPGQGRDRLAELQEQVIAANRFGIPAIAHEECLTGFTTLGATCYPASIAWGASFNPELIKSMAARIGADMKKMGVHQGLSPVLDVVRDYRWGRVEETIGEDPHLVGELAVAYVKGLQGSGVNATLKHFAGYAASQAGRNHAPVSIGPRALEDVVFPPFERAVREAQVASVMNSYADIDGEAPAASRRLLTEVLRERWGFTGTVVADYWAVSFLHSMHEIAESEDAAGLLALSAGMDVELPETISFANLAEAVRAGRLHEDVLNTAVSRVLTQKIEAGLLDPDYDPRGAWLGDDTELDSIENRKHARAMAEESIILLRNEQILPLKSPARMAVIGPSATQPRTHLGCYSFTNHVYSRFAEHEDYGVEMVSILQALEDSPALAGSNIEYVRGVDFTDLDDSGIEQAVQAARNAEVAVVTVGDLAGLFGRGTSGEGCDVVDLKLPGRQAELVEAVLETGTPTVLVLVTGRPYSLGQFAHRAAGIVQCFMPGVEGGPALAAVLTGQVNPSGKLPVQIPDHVGGQPGTYLTPKLGWHSDGVSNLDPRPLYPFGYGISYTEFEISELQLSHTEISTEGNLEISATITNTGGFAGAEVVQLYLSDEVSQVVRPRRWLAGFAKVQLEAGASTRVTFDVHADRTSFIGLDGRRIVEPGNFIATVGSSSEDLRLQGQFRIVGHVRELKEGRVMDTPVRID
ncbi:glycoside hydrolase family 3 N-terminal domain-containing protein [Glutamicibacter sp. M10]|uniref:glycoside hydrolase family 3 N-terminal domain-containing protein n=1 Tax=Glutamicibacter sp. M10 TaxID=3023076 RepID=UPI0021C74A0D|nr:glycoside hydrolase family 3 N-terminal domain-containing protein [Glutamicibacter sp. M10]UXN32224.1 glycoside hydrolase family 3 C-terminal domain-containing protein [Glutamicibacter sp. M10]